MVTESARLDATRRAFDAVASRYAPEVGANIVLEAMRARSIAMVERWVSTGASLLEVGCGPGLDAGRLAAAGYRVTAIDASTAMICEARRRLESSPAGQTVRLLDIGMAELDRLRPETYDGAYSSLGVLNCVGDLTAAARALSERLRDRAVLVATVMGRVCPWELALCVARRQWARAGIRFTTRAVPVSFDGHTVWTRYYAPREFSAALRLAGFELLDLRGLAVLAPPPYLDRFARRHPGLTRMLLASDDRIGRWPFVRQSGDHFLVVMRKMTGASR